MDDNDVLATGLIFIGLFSLCLYFVPTIIAIARRHSYTGVIIALNIFGGWTGLGWIAALAWSVWPNEKALIDPFIGNPTGLGRRNAGDVLGAVDYGRQRGRRSEARARDMVPDGGDGVEQLVRLAKLRDDGILNENEFSAAKAEILARLV